METMGYTFSAERWMGHWHIVVRVRSEEDGQEYLWRTLLVYETTAYEFEHAILEAQTLLMDCARRLE